MNIQDDARAADEFRTSDGGIGADPLEGRPYRVWVLPPGKANEAVDTAVGALRHRRPA